MGNTAQLIITTFAVLSAIVGIITLIVKVVHWFDKHNERDDDIKNLQTQHSDDINEIKTEQALVVYGLLACLKGLQEKGCNGPVTEAIDKLTKYLNQKAHNE